jgi:hypothetical protein
MASADEIELPPKLVVTLICAEWGPFNIRRGELGWHETPAGFFGTGLQRRQTAQLLLRITFVARAV